MLAYTGLETVANLAEETREPGTTLPRSLFSSIGLVVIVTVLIAIVGVCAFPADDGTTALGDEWLQAPIVGIVTALEGHSPTASSTCCGSSSASRARSSSSRPRRLRSPAARGCALDGRARHVAAEFGRLDRRSLVSREALVATGILAVAVVVGTGHARRRRCRLPREHLLVRRAPRLHRRAAGGDPAALTEPDLPRPFRAPPEVRSRGVLVPLPALIGAPLTFVVWVLALITHPGARYAGPPWLAGRARRVRDRAASRARRRLRRHRPVAQLPPGRRRSRRSSCR